MDSRGGSRPGSAAFSAGDSPVINRRPGSGGGGENNNNISYAANSSSSLMQGGGGPPSSIHRPPSGDTTGTSRSNLSSATGGPSRGEGAPTAGNTYIPKIPGVSIPEQEEVERMMITLHDTMGQLSMFLTSKEKKNQFQQEGVDDDGEDEDELLDPSKQGTSENPAHVKPTDLLDGFLYYIRSIVGQAMKGGRRSHVAPMNVPSANSAGGNSRQRESEASQLRNLLKATIAELDAERREKHELMTEMREFNRLISEYRAETNVLQVYKDRIVELQSVINGTKKPGDIGAQIGGAEDDVLDDTKMVPSEATPTPAQKRKEVTNELSRLAIRSKESGDRLKVENMKLTNDKVALIGQNSILQDRVKVLEAQLSVLTASSSIALRELNKQRLQTAVQVEAPHSIKKKLGKGEVRVGGTIMEAEVAVWLKNMYSKLLQDADATKQLMNIRDDGSVNVHLADNSSGTGLDIGATTTSAMSGGQSSQNYHQSTSGANNTTNNTTNASSRRGATPSRGQRVGATEETREGKNFTQFVANLPSA